MSDMMQTGFDYGALPVELAISLKLHADRFDAVRNRAIYEMGKEIYEAQQELASHDKTQGQFGRWVESLDITRQTGYDLITLYQGIGSDVVKLFDNKKLGQTVAVMLLRAPQSVADKAIEQAEAGDKVTVADVKQWKEAAQAASQRAEEFRQESNIRRKKIRELEQQVDLLKAEKQEPEVRIEAPSDYEATKERATKLASDLKKLKEQQANIVQKQVASKIKERESELAEIDQKIKGSEEILAGLQKHIDRYSYQQRELKVHLNAIEEARKALVLLAANLEGFESVIDHDHELRLWRALSQMMRNGADAIDFFVGDSKPALTVIK